MATRYNPYALDPALSAGIGNLTKALIGSASDDAAIARGRASDALAGYRQAQTRGENLKSQFAQDQLERQTKALSDSELVNSIFDTLGLPRQRVEQGVDVATSPGMATAMGVNQGQSIPFNRTVPINYDPEAVKSLVGSTLFGGVPGNPQQSSEMGLNLQNLTQNKLARDLLLSSGNTPTAIGKALLGLPTGKYDERDSQYKLAQIAEESDQAQTKEKEEGKTKRKSMSLDNAIVIQEMKERGLGERQKEQLLTDKFIANQELQHKTKITKMELALKEEIEILKTETKDKTDRLIAEKKLEAENANSEKKLALEKEIAQLKEQNRVKIAQMTDATKRWEFNNRTLTATFDQTLIVSEEYARAKNIPKQTEGRYKGMYIIDGGRDPSKMMVKLNANQTVFMSKELADDFNIPENERGQFKAEGVQTKTDSSLTDAKKFDKKFEDDFKIAQEDEDNKLTPRIAVRLRAYLQDIVNSQIEANDLPFDEAYNSFVIPVITGGNTRLNPPGVGGANKAFVIPTALFNSVKTQAGRGARKEDLVKMIKKVGYSTIQANFVYEKAVQ